MLHPSWQGYVQSVQDALILFEVCFSGIAPLTPRRPTTTERSYLIQSGSIFIYHEGEAGIKRWTDDLNWSPSRILGGFLIYREMSKPKVPGQKRQIIRRPNRRHRCGASQEATGSESPSNEDWRLVGSLTDSDDFKYGGLMKKTITISVHDSRYHLISYYCPNDVKEGKLHVPSSCRLLTHTPRFLLMQALRCAFEAESTVAQFDSHEHHPATSDPQDYYRREPPGGLPALPQFANLQQHEWARYD